MLYLPAVCSGFAQSNLDPPLFGFPAGSPGPYLLSGTPTARSLQWGYLLLRMSIHIQGGGLAMPPLSPHWLTGCD
ncbi:unnamed protein product [Staurois parvus]|uniref:Uncharacterized protein n=1 Tax=Staurois parvus TaxID=386267 RepID=A0ABN9DNS8_9NEOB|nr:unnamed protein product [Staurois parvus]